MNSLALNTNVFIRSMATRGSMGGLARQAAECADVLDAAGYDYIFYETVGVGQVELDIAQAADTTIVLIVPESGDVIQNLKAGLMEIGDIFVLNKADRPDAERMMRDLKYVLHLKEQTKNWSPGVLQTIAHKGKGIEELRQELRAHRDYLETDQQLNKTRDIRLKRRVETIIRQKLEHHFWNEKRKQMLDEYLENEKERLSPYELAERMLERMLNIL
jgi:LAO/AO transport system kinase